MGFLAKFIAKIILNGFLLYGLNLYFKGFTIAKGMDTLIIGALVLTLLSVFVKPVIRVVTAPLVWITFGFFNIVIYMAIFWFADKILTQLNIADLPTLFWSSLILGIVNAIL